MYQNILDAIEENSHGAGQLLDRRGNYCILGYLLHKAGERDVAMRGRGLLSDDQLARLVAAYPLTRERINQLANTNDEAETLADRRRDLRKVVSDWEIEDQMKE